MLDEALRKVVRDEVRKALREEVLPELREMRAAGSGAAPAPTALDDYLSPEEAGALWHVAPKTVREWVRQKRLKRYGTPRAVRVSRAELAALMAAPPAPRVD